MNKRLMLLLPTGVGAAAMYYLDPERGRKRRALARDRIVHAGHEAERGLRVIGRDTRNRVLGTAATASSLLDSEQPDDDVLRDRVRAILGRAVSHPGSIEVSAHEGVVTLSGPILEEEVPLLLDAALGVRGVRNVLNELEAHAEPGRIPGLQGEPRRPPGRRAAFMQENWSPAERTVGGLGGAIAALYGFSHRSAGGTLLGTAGLLLLARAATNLEMRRLSGIGAQYHAVDVRKSIRIHAPVEKVFQLWDNFENFPSFMTHVRRVRRLADDRGGDRWRWTVRGPTGMEFEFDALVAAREENRLLAWRTEGGAFIQHAGRVQFQSNADSSTTVDVKMAYNPVGGAIGHAIARLFRADPKHQLDDDLLRMKTWLETGKVPHDAAEPPLETRTRP